MSAAVAGGSPDSGRHRNRTYDVDHDDEDSNRMKTEPDSDIKDYAETTMNELLGWYGLDKLDARSLNLKNLNHHFPTSSSSSSPLRQDDDIMSEDDMGRSSRSPVIESESLISNPSNEAIICAWCQKTGLKLFTLKTSSGKTKVFCSEPCFNQCRRAAFKKNRVCNWCRHVRHTVNYVDFKDGDEQLQFCSDKCLNQYKMQIFCRETQAYLQMNPHLQEETSKNIGNANSKLITPDLWLRDCQEPINGGQNLSHSDDDSVSPNVRTFPQNPVRKEIDLEDLSMKHKSEKITFPPLQRDYSQSGHKSPDNSTLVKDKRSLEMCNALSSYLREERDKNSVERRRKHFENDREHFRKKQRLANLRHKTNPHQEAPPAHLASSVHPSITFPGQNRLYPPPVSPYISQNSSPINPPAAHSKSIPSHPGIAGSLLPPGLPPPPPLLNNDFIHSQFNPQFFQPPFGSLSHPQHLEAFLRMQSTMNRRTDPLGSHIYPDPVLPNLKPSMPHFNAGSSAPPNTVMLPYPIFLPLPVPIPIPIPLSSFLKKEKQTNASGIESGKAKNLSINGESSDDKQPDTKTEDNMISVLKKLKNSKQNVNDTSTKKEKSVPSPDTSSYAVTNNDSQTNRLILTRNKNR
ncbi:sine oculis-binding protein homolog [Parasteatoda tepidariorum]|uniref:sine oculis-binding protein homolog n=1 Tax=Parasteatoda tepidariorum TaxID=114398 RepID=UPI00077FDA84|nr:sine oculis-binding protein homolog B-like [Parasteatoda tepidariorum]